MYTLEMRAGDRRVTYGDRCRLSPLSTHMQISPVHYATHLLDRVTSFAPVLRAYRPISKMPAAIQDREQAERKSTTCIAERTSYRSQCTTGSRTVVSSGFHCRLSCSLY